MADLGTQIRNAIREKRVGDRRMNMDDAAELLEISRSALYSKLDSKTLSDDKEFLRDVQEKLGINVTNPEHSSNAVPSVSKRKVGNVEMRYHTIPLKEKRLAECWLPNDFDKKDAATIKQWLLLIESTL